MEHGLSFRGPTAAILLLLPVSAGAQTPGDSAPAVVRAVEIRRNDVFDSTEAHNWLFRLANRLHITTRASVVRREILLRPGEIYDSAAAAETARNLRALGIFRRVVVDTVHGDSGLTLRVETSDGWSTRPDYRFKSTGGQADYTIAFIEDNVLGTATQASVRYRHSVDRTSTSFGFLQPRFIWPSLRLGTIFQDRSDGRRFSALVGKPFYAQSSRNSLLFLYDDRNERILRFFEGERVASDSVRRDYQLLKVEGAVAIRASDRGYLRAGISAQFRKDRYRRESASAFSTPDEATYAAGPFVEWRRGRYMLTRSYQGFGREEDVDISTLVRIGLIAAPRAFNYQRDGIAPQIQAKTGTSFGAGFLFADLLADGLYDRNGLDSGSVVVAGTLVLQPGTRHTFIAHGDAGWLKQPLSGQEFDLGLGSGPRAFRSHAFTGDRTFYSTAEYRYVVKEELWQLVGIGLAGFVDYGGAWYDGSTRRTGWDAGIGVRLGASRASGVEAIRIDLARRFATDVEGAGWVIAVGKGLTFSTNIRTIRSAD
ncbi:MAG: hypothetical protein ABI836_05030 [Gemmatimonadota bacterium]